MRPPLFAFLYGLDVLKSSTMDSSTASVSGGEETGDVAVIQTHILRLWEVHLDVHGQAIDKLRIAKGSISWDDVKKDLDGIITILSPQGVLNASEYFQITTKALASLTQVQKMWPSDELNEARQLIRDLMTVWCQMNILPVGDKEKFIRAICPWIDITDEDEYSRILQSYRKIIGEKFAEATPCEKRKRPRKDRAGRCPTLRL